jgi:hypothetical protein
LTMCALMLPDGDFELPEVAAIRRRRVAVSCVVWWVSAGSVIVGRLLNRHRARCG